MTIILSAFIRDISLSKQ